MQHNIKSFVLLLARVHMKRLLVSNDSGLNMCVKQCQKQQQMEINSKYEHRALKCKKKKKVTGGGRLCLGLASAHSQGSVPVRSCLHLVGQLECVLGRAQQSGADQRCSDAPRGCGGGLAGPGTSGPRPRPD